MGNDLARSNILYPFTPDSEAHRTLVQGINDCFMVIPPQGASGVPLPFRDYFVFLYSITVNPSDVVYLFRASSPLGIHDIPFTVPRDTGLVRIATDNPDMHAVIIADTDNIYTAVPGETLLGDTPYAEVEPVALVWRTDTLTSVNFINAYRNWDPNDRDPDGLPTTLIKTVTGGDLKLASGYNVSLQYDKETETLYVRGIPGAGKGLPDTIPWDEGPPAGAEQNIKTLNGLSGNVRIAGSDSVVATASDNEVILEVS